MNDKVSTTSPEDDKPSPQKPDWKLAEGLYFQRVPLAQICQQCRINKVDTLKKYAQRHGWTQVKAALIAHSKTVTISTKQSPPDEAKPKIKGLIGDYLNHPFLNESAKTMNRLKDQTFVLQSLAGTAKQAYGWCEESEQRLVRIEEMNAITPEQANIALGLVPDPSKAIDVPTVPPDTQPTQPTSAQPNDSAPPLPPEQQS